MSYFPAGALVGLFVAAAALTGGRMASLPTPAPAPPVTASPVPVVVELFPSEGCSSCPSADAVLRDLKNAQSIAGVEVRALGQHVDYWNRPGWKDPFSSAQLTARQRQYAEAPGAGTYTPQAVVNGQTELVGAQRGQLTAAIARVARAPRTTVALSRSGARALAVQASALPAGTRPTEALVALTESGLSTKVKRGENGGRILQHASVVRALRELGPVGSDGTFSATIPLDLAADWPAGHLRAVVLVQERESRRIVGAGALLLGAAN